MDWKERIEIDAGIAFGKPRIRGTRLTVEFLLSLLAKGWTEDQLLDAYPHLTREDLRAVYALASEVLSEDEFLIAGKLVA